jgi:hypothetical protein
MHVYEVRPRKDHRGVDLISHVLPFDQAHPNGRSRKIIGSGVDRRCPEEIVFKKSEGNGIQKPPSAR